MKNKEAYKRIKESSRSIVGELEHSIYFKFIKTPTSRLVAIMQSGKQNLDDETFELIARCKSAGIEFQWTQSYDNPKILFI